MDTDRLDNLLHDEEERFAEIRQSSKLIYDGAIVHLYRDTVTLPDGKSAIREVIHHIGAVCVVPVTDNGEVILVRQFRYPLGKMVLEIPAGKLNSKDEDPESAVLRELEEETGYSCRELNFIGDIHTTVGFCDEVIHMYSAHGLTKGAAHPDDDEFIDTVKLPLKEAVEMILNGQLTDGKTQAAILKVYIQQLKHSCEDSH